MITGEHAVVYGHPAIVAAIEQRITVRLRATEAPTLSITSEIAAPLTLPMTALVAEGPYRFVIACVMRHLSRVTGGVEVDIRSEIDPTLGLGSSAAVTVAMLAALQGSVTGNLHGQALEIIREMQGRGSGADLAASVHGGAVSYQIKGDGPAEVTPLPAPPPLSLFNVGYKTPTAEVLARVATAREANPAEIDAIYEEMGHVSKATIDRAAAGHWAEIGPHLTDYQALMGRLGVSDAALEAAIETGKATDGVIGIKISGSGLGDCVVAVGTAPPEFQPVDLAQEGVVIYDNG